MANYRKRAVNCLKTLKNLPFLNTREQTLVLDEYIRIQERLKHFCAPHTMVSRVCDVYKFGSVVRGQHIYIKAHGLHSLTKLHQLVHPAGRQQTR